MSVPFRFKVGQGVKHNFSGTSGIIRDVRTDVPNGYCYLVEFVIENGLTRSDWYQEKVLLEDK